MASIALHLSENGIETVSFLDKDPAIRDQTLKFYNLLQPDLDVLEKQIIKKHQTLMQGEVNDDESI